MPSVRVQIFQSRWLRCTVGSSLGVPQPQHPPLHSAQSFVLQRYARIPNSLPASEPLTERLVYRNATSRTSRKQYQRQYGYNNENWKVTVNSSHSSTHIPLIGIIPHTWQYTTPNATINKPGCFHASSSSIKINLGQRREVCMGKHGQNVPPYWLVNGMHIHACT